MSRRSTLYNTFLATALVIASLSSVTTAQTTCKGKSFEVTSYGSAASAKRALSISEATHAHAEKIFGRSRKKRKESLKLHLFPSPVEFSQAIARLPDSVGASDLVSYASPKNATAYVATHPQASGAALKALVLTGPTARRVAHEAVRVYCYGNLANHTTLPVWLIEGAASTIAQTVLASQGMAMESLHEDPFTSSQIGVVLGLSKAGKLPPVGSVLAGRVSGLSPSEQDAVHAILFHYLLTEKHKSRFKRVLKKANTMKPSPDLTKKLARYAGTTLKVERVNDDFKNWLADDDPVWNEIVPSLSRHSDGWASTAYPNLNAVAWKVDAVGKKSWSMSGSFTIFDGPTSQLNLLLGHRDTGFFSIALDAGFGASLFSFDSQTSSWSEIAGREFSGIKKDKSHKFALSITGPTLTLSIDDEEVLSTSVDGADFSGAWGLGAQAGSAGLWQGLTVK